MPRIGRVVVPNMPHHVVQRGHNRNAVFLSAADYEYYLNTLQTWKVALGVKIYTWCLMTNHIHMIVDPGDDTKSIGLLMKRLAGRQTRYVNSMENRTGSLWEGRYKLSIIDTDEYLAQCCRYVDLNPVKARMVNTPGEYRWSGYREIVGMTSEFIVDRHHFTNMTGMCEEKYRSFCCQKVDKEAELFISARLESNRLTGSSQFVNKIERRIGIRLEYKKPGRPNKIN